jgi:tetratricopeptide (TPR) repeat protein
VHARRAASANGVPGLSPRDAADSARKLIALGQDAALQGDHTAARDAFVVAAQLAPTNARVAYYLGREHEDLGEQASASREYCRYLALLPEAPDADEVRGRILRLTPRAEIARIDEARANFRSGVALLQQRHLVAADSAFSIVIRIIPGAPEAHFNRALSRAARGERAAAMQDFERYLQLSPGANDQTAIRAAMSRLQDRVYDASSVFFQGLIAPGVGQMATGRPIRGVFILALSGGMVAAGLTSKSELQVQEYRDPFGNPYTDTVRVTERPYLLPAAGAVAAVWLLSAIEASAFARVTLAWDPRVGRGSAVRHRTLGAERRTAVARASGRRDPRPHGTLAHTARVRRALTASAGRNRLVRDMRASTCRESRSW